jgi:excinuclease ABC subunit A
MKETDHTIIIKGAREHNLKNVNLVLPKNKLIVFTGVSGSGKSSLCMDTLYAEGQRRYVESLSSYARQFLMRMNKPDVDSIKGICPAIAVEQKVTTKTTRSTVGTLTEIYDYLRLLYARVGKTYSPISGEIVKKHEVNDVIDYVFALPADSKVQILAPIVRERALSDELNILLQKGYTRVVWNDTTYKIEALQALKTKEKTTSFSILIDRVTAEDSDENRSRVADSIQTAFYESAGECIIEVPDSSTMVFNNRFELDGMKFEEPSQHFFNFNNPFGACKTCEGFGTIMGIDEDLVMPDKNLSVYEQAIACWRGEKMKEWNERLIKVAAKFDFPIHRAIKDLSKKERKLLWTGNDYFDGLDAFFKYIEEQSYKIQYRVMLSRYRGRTACPDCGGSRIRPDSDYVKIGGVCMSEILMLPIDEVFRFFTEIKLTAQEKNIADRVIEEINNRLKVMVDIGLGYLTLNRFSNTLSGGETQRINLTRILGSNLTESMYMLDEPSIGLHSKDTEKLISVIKSLRDMGNTVIVVEHDEEMIREADHLVDMGPYAGRFGGEVVFNGNAKDIATAKNSLTGKYLLGELEIKTPLQRRKFTNSIQILGASQHNLKNVDARFPLNVLTVVTGVSGSGKTTLVKKILYPAMANLMEDGSGEKPGLYREIKGEYKQIKAVEMIDQNPLGRTSRSNAVTYTKSYDSIRELFASQQLSKIRGYKAKDFSFNVEGGRCETCKGEGEVVVEMQFLADVHLVCENCKGKRFKSETLEVTYKEKNIFEVLNLSIDEAMEFFESHADIFARLKPLQDIGLGYIKLGQSTSTLSGGEAQRLKLASFLGKGAVTYPILFIFDEPTTGLHFYDIEKLLLAFDALIKLGHTIVVIEHNLDVIKCADWLIDLGPEGGKYGGEMMYQGVPEGIVEIAESHTSRYLKDKLPSKKNKIHPF